MLVALLVNDLLLAAGDPAPEISVGIVALAPGMIHGGDHRPHAHLWHFAIQVELLIPGKGQEPLHVMVFVDQLVLVRGFAAGIAVDLLEILEHAAGRLVHPVMGRAIRFTARSSCSMDSSHMTNAAWAVSAPPGCTGPVGPLNAVLAVP